ncbi:MAG TPA: DM13 domain-containing protein [Actinomycetota bacterium]|nr:DM13 domain-containing protein [Actinomycetota bacterium]
MLWKRGVGEPIEDRRRCGIRCSTCRTVRGILEERVVEANYVRYLDFGQNDSDGSASDTTDRATARADAVTRLREIIRAHRGAAIGTAAVLIAVIVFVAVWFQPQKLIIEETVNEALPTSDADSNAPPQNDDTDDATTAPAPGGPKVVAEGSFQSLEHMTAGTAQVLQVGDRSFLRFENLDTSNGPDLRVYLSEVPASDDWYAYGERFIDLGALKGNRGNQNYAIPDGTDLSRYQSAVIWCRRFTVGFGVAPLESKS